MELSRLQKLAVANKLSPDDIHGGTMTLSNIGAIGGKFGSPLINVPEVAIIALGRIQKVPHFGEDGNVYPMSVMTVSTDPLNFFLYTDRSAYRDGIIEMMAYRDGIIENPISESKSKTSG